MPDGERAPDSLYYLADALVQLKKPQDACKVYGELTDVYGSRISGTMKVDIAAGRDRAGCKYRADPRRGAGRALSRGYRRAVRPRDHARATRALGRGRPHRQPAARPRRARRPQPLPDHTP